MACEDIPSLLDLQKVKKHADDFGRLMGTGEGTSTNGVTGQVRPTYNKVIGDMNSEFDAQLAGMGYAIIGKFSTGATLTNPRQTLLWDVVDGGDGQEYGWSGSFLPSGKVVQPGSNPHTTGGIAVGSWMSRFDPELKTIVFEVLRRSYAEADYNLIGRFSNTGLVVTAATDVVLWEQTGVAYSYSGTLPHTISAVESPVGNPLWLEVASELLRDDLSEIDGASLIGGASYATLRSYTGSADRIHVFGRVNIFDLANGIFVRSNTDTTSVDDDGIVLIDALGRRWRRQYLGDVHPEWFGAKGDGVADDTSAIQKMFDSKNNSPILVNNFFSTFQIRRKHRITASINAGRPIKVDAYGAEFIVEGNFNAITFSMHNGEWAGGYFNYMNVPNAAITELAVAIQLAPETNPIQVMNSVIRGVRVWGAHTGVKFQNPNTAIWMVELANLELVVRAGSSAQKACGVNLDASGGAGGSTTVNLRKVSVGGKGTTVGAGLKGYRINGVNEVSFYDCSYDGYELSPGVDRIVNSKDILDITAFRCNIDGFHTEQLVNNTAPFTPSPIYINTNSFYMNGMEMLLTKVIGGPAWVYLDGDGVATIGTWHDIPAAGQTVGRILDISGVDPSIKIISTGALKAADIIGGKSRIAVSLATEPSPYGTNTDITTTPGNAIMTLPTDCEACEVTVVGEDTTDSTLGWFSHLMLVKAGNGVWVVNERTVKMVNFTAAVMGYNVSGNNLVWTNNSSLNYRVQCRVESKRAAIATF